MEQIDLLKKNNNKKKKKKKKLTTDDLTKDLVEQHFRLKKRLSRRGQGRRKKK